MAIIVAIRCHFVPQRTPLDRGEHHQDANLLGWSVVTQSCNTATSATFSA